MTPSRRTRGSLARRSEVGRSREEFLARLNEARQALGGERASRPVRRTWLLPLLAAAAGVALAWRVRGRRRDDD